MTLQNCSRVNRPTQDPRQHIIYLLAIVMAFGGCAPPEAADGVTSATAALYSLPLPAAEVGRSFGAFAVTDDGVATYRVPIAVPPGRNGLTPEISIAYASTESDGAVGVGWSLAGLSAVTRCPRFAALDGMRAGIQFDMSDPLCLDGRRLLLVSGQNGEVGAVYRPEVGPERVAITIANLDAVASRIEVWLPDGSRSYYGGSDETEVRGPRYANHNGHVDAGQLPAATLSWLLRRVRDTSGNTIDIGYRRTTAESFPSAPDQLAFEIRPETIMYSGEQIDLNDFDNTLRGNREVLLEWLPRTDDTTVSYVSGMPLLHGSILHRVSSSVLIEEGLVEILRTYDFGYEAGPTSHRMRLQSIHECEEMAAACRPLRSATQTRMPP